MKFLFLLTLLRAFAADYCTNVNVRLPRPLPGEAVELSKDFFIHRLPKGSKVEMVSQRGNVYRGTFDDINNEGNPIIQLNDGR